MRWIFILLLVANVIYFGWELDRETGIRHRQTASVLPVPASAQQLKLLEELSDPPEPRTIDTGRDDVAMTESTEPGLLVPGELVTDLPEINMTEADTTIVTYTCFRYGPLLDSRSRLTQSSKLTLPSLSSIRRHSFFTASVPESTITSAG